MSRWKKEETQDGRYVAAEDRNASQNARTAQTVGKTENFFTRNVKLITFLVCIGVFLVVFGPIAVWGTVGFPETDSRRQMTLDDAIRLSEQSGSISLSQLRKFAGDEQVKDYDIYYYIEIEPDHLILAVADKSTEMLLYCKLTNLDTGESVDMLTEDVRAFVQEN